MPVSSDIQPGWRIEQCIVAVWGVKFNAPYNRLKQQGEAREKQNNLTDLSDYRRLKPRAD